jgi:hypothetical protein
VFDPTAAPSADKLGEATLPDSCTGAGCTSVIVFDSTTNAPTLRTYVQDAINNSSDKKVSVALMITGACGNGTVSLRMDSKDTTTGGVIPTLDLESTTAVTQRSFQAADPAVNWPLIAGLGALVALAAGGVLFYRKRATTH